LISNALKFTREGKITVRIDLDATDPSKLRFDVVDTGLGIKEEDKDHLFKMFGRCQDQSSRKNNTRGVGLGLTICKRLVEQFEGEIGF